MSGILRPVNAQPLKNELETHCHALAGQPMSGADVIVQVLPTRASMFCSAIPVARSCRCTTPCSATTPMHLDNGDESDAADRAGQRAGRRLHGGGLCARLRQGRRGRGHLRPRRHQHGDAGARLDGRLDSHGGDLRPGATTAIGSDAFQEAPISNIMGACAKHVFLVTDPSQLEATCAPRSRSPAAAAPARWWWTCRRTCRTPRCFRRQGQLPLPGYRARLRAMQKGWMSDACAAFFARWMPRGVR
jgi:acetolactate synthase-1/2/3 large subunit